MRCGKESRNMYSYAWYIWEGFITPPEGTNMGPGFNRGTGGGARGCGFEERVGGHALTEGGHFL